MTEASPHGRAGPAFVIAIGAAVVLGAVGLFASRPDIAAMGLPLATWSALMIRQARRRADVVMTFNPMPGGEGEVRTAIEVDSAADAVELVLVQAQRRTRRLIVPASGGSIIARSRVLHSGPILAVQAAARGVSGDGALLFPASRPTVAARSIAPPRQGLDVVPVPRTLTGLHGAHEGRRPGQGGDFRDIHPFAPGDELRRVDWRATARLARRPGDLLVRRTTALSEASVVIAMDTAEDLGTVVASWGTGDFERSGVTSLDRARQAAGAIAAAAIGEGDRVALHVLVYGGRSLRSGGGARHLARLETTIAAIGQAGEDARFRRTPHVAHGSVIYVLSTFFEGAAAQTAMMWRAGGHRVVAVDVLPDLDLARLTKTQLIALRVVLAERENIFGDLRGAGVDVILWSDEAAAELRAAARSRR
ncbi:uncharacterized protein (DUF58 family) [Microbacterium natoriense]|uniref:Uncharacterized protein (DUF58 family) n=1 Tax=Microbacterium natoriense TaxID=284570 RepID=A0AAW8F2P4_9MICO|nr:DUF58 domain-containing protein [Microbacterium natoriense]MDQ0648736.1 uncharacterized protein (DUF58 family) [Microbacterium natoriense]